MTKRHFLKNFSTDFSGILVARRQIDAGEGTESLASMSDAVFELSRKFGRGGDNICPPPAGCGLTLGWSGLPGVVLIIWKSQILHVKHWNWLPHLRKPQSPKFDENWLILRTTTMTLKFWKYYWVPKKSSILVSFWGCHDENFKSGIIFNIK